MKRLLSIILLMCMCLTEGIAQETHADMYVVDASAAPGTQSAVSINIENTANGVAGFSCKVELPEGFTVEKASRGSRLMAKNASDEYNTTFLSQLQADGSYMLLAYGGVPFEGTDGEVAVLTVNIPEDAAFGDYVIRLKEIETSVGAYTMQTYTEIDGTLTIGEPSFEEGYTVQTLPFIMEVDGDYEMSVTMDNVDAVKSIEFDLVIPDGLYIDGEEGEFFVDLGSRVTSSTVSNQFSGSVEENADGSFHVLAKFKRSTSTYVFTGNSGEALVFPMFADGLSEGLHEVEFKNIILNGELKVAPYKVSFIVGAPTLKGNVTLYGKYVEGIEVLGCVASNSAVTSIDLTNVVDIDNNASISTANSNALIYLPKDKNISNEYNVVVDNECSNLSLTDSYPFSSLKPFTAASASYSRSMVNDWGTICLPFVIESSEDMQIYELKSRDESTLVFAEVASLEAGKPGVFRKASENASVNVIASNVAVVGSPVEGDAAEGLKLVGTYEKVRVDVDSNAPSYYIKDNMFLQGVEYFSVGAFRAYFESDAMAGVKEKNFSIVIEDATGVRTAIGTLDMESGDIYTLNGVKVKGASGNGIYVKSGKKYFIK